MTPSDEEGRTPSGGDDDPSTTEGLAHIGRVADAVGLSLRTIRHYEEMGLVTPSGRTAGGFRLYDAQDVDRLLLIKRMKPLGYTLEEMAALLQLIDALAVSAKGGSAPPDALGRLRAYADAAQDRIADLRAKVAYAEEFRDRILAEVERAQHALPADPG